MSKQSSCIPRTASVSKYELMLFALVGCLGLSFAHTFVMIKVTKSRKTRLTSMPQVLGDVLNADRDKDG